MGFEIGDFMEIFEAQDREGGGGEGVFAGVLGGTGGFGAIGGELFLQTVCGQWGTGCSFDLRCSTGRGVSLEIRGANGGREGDDFVGGR